jgi:hypothetical protein
VGEGGGVVGGGWEVGGGGCGVRGKKKYKN